MKISSNYNKISFGVTNHPQIAKHQLEKLIAEGKKQAEICNELSIPKHYLVKLLRVYNLSMRRNVELITERYKKIMEYKDAGYTYKEMSFLTGDSIKKLKKDFIDYKKLTMTYCDFCETFPRYKLTKIK